ncbi:hypothetical protein [Cellulomonas iranensis]|uniref:hypothetical protein n=1 Tax=Cellulomonas iranensis TaxID=76862 RepID=UPI0013D82E56|nr:hypothetical protein [Cellulomonas iranensis]
MSTDETQPLAAPADPEPTAPDPTTAGFAPGEAAAPRPGVRVSTVVGGLIGVLLGVGVLLVAAGYTIDVELAAIVLLILAGVGLILGPLVQGMRRGRGARVPR